MLCSYIDNSDYKIRLKNEITDCIFIANLRNNVLEIFYKKIIGF